MKDLNSKHPNAVLLKKAVLSVVGTLLVMTLVWAASTRPMP